VLTIDNAELVMLGLVMLEQRAAVMSRDEQARLPVLLRELNELIMRAAPFRYADGGPAGDETTSADGEPGGNAQPANAPAGVVS